MSFVVAEEVFEDFLNFGSLGLHIVDNKGIICWANRTELELLGYSEQEYIGQHIAKFHVDQDKITEILDLLLRGEKVVNYVAPVRCKDQRIEYLEINSSMRKVEGTLTTTRCFSACVTQRVLREERLQKEQEQEKKRKDSSSRSN